VRHETETNPETAYEMPLIRAWKSYCRPAIPRGGPTTEMESHLGR